ncbi:fucose-1-phosphate guanylyltransferase-like [Stegodyphus dumicola]|uniref:fucose-1-phosphate guanylyltransferase-like n=1 Tax=Stegodyphus dumicola TaxID=202533 RepID=UPI0015A88381|nr:fucose-1-phosphate guanylyltransferase-like [Stegodyphus dumicola]XP_035232442.1 fucose-1-phosphate guanylyltransferase-like [Stegodyphus dumicola]XP_035232443.1 fucose-1-phosphate guanylyltransferase-like [Stegodyphus dumicola]
MDNEEKESLICQYMKELLNNYNKIRGRSVDSQELFWDAVIISASDTGQKKGYEAQIAEKLCRGEIPLDIPFHVFADPPGYKIDL